MRKSMRGVTLMELMIVVVILGILAVVAYPNYRQYAARAKRTEAKAAFGGISRKWLIPLLEYFDKIGATRRDQNRLRRSRACFAQRDPRLAPRHHAIEARRARHCQYPKTLPALTKNRRT